MSLRSITVQFNRSHACKCVVIGLNTHGVDVRCIHGVHQILGIGNHFIHGLKLVLAPCQKAYCTRTAAAPPTAERRHPRRQPEKQPSCPGFEA